MNKSVSITVSMSTNPAVSGRYFVDVRDTTEGRDRQMTTRHEDDPRAFVRELTAVFVNGGIAVVVMDNTLEDEA